MADTDHKNYYNKVTLKELFRVLDRSGLNVLFPNT